MSNLNEERTDNYEKTCLFEPKKKACAGCGERRWCSGAVCCRRRRWPRSVREGNYDKCALKNKNGRVPEVHRKPSALSPSLPPLLFTYTFSFLHTHANAPLTPILIEMSKRTLAGALPALPSLLQLWKRALSVWRAASRARCISTV